MSNIQSPNQFNQTAVVGDTSLPRTGMVISAQVNTGEGTALIPGQAVKIVDSAGGVPKVTALTALTDAAFGVVLYNLKNATFPALAPIELGMRNTIVYMTAGGAIARGAFVEFVYTTNKVVLNATNSHPAIGIAFDKASADGDVIRVLLDVPNTESVSA